MTMPIRLEPVYLANVLLHVTSVMAIKAFPFVSKSCREAMLTLKTNPAAYCDAPRAILRLFPNINTMAVRDLSCFDRDALPDTVTALVVASVDFNTATEERLKFADRVVEIRGCESYYAHPADFSLFPRLERLALDKDPERLTLPRHRLKHLRVFCRWWMDDPFVPFPPECAEQITFVFPGHKAFAEAKARPRPPHVRVLCSQISAGVGPEDYFTVWSSTDTITLSDAFWVDDLRAFVEKHPLPHRDGEMTFNTACAACDVSFVTTLTGLSVKTLSNCTLTLPTSVVSLTTDSATKDVAVSGVENLTRLSVVNESVTTAPCPRLRELRWKGEALSETTPSCLISGSTTLAALTVFVSTIDPAFRLPLGLTSLDLHVFRDSVDTALLSPLTQLQRLHFNNGEDGDPVDLSGLTTLTELDAGDSPVSKLPTSLVSCSVLMQSYFDFSPLTNLTSLLVAVDPGVHVTLPTGVSNPLYFERQEYLF